jgi:hypothetical protein
MPKSLTATQRRVAKLWAKFMRLGFPKRAVGRKVNGVDLMSLDTYTAGCVTTYINRGRLDLWRTAILGLCYRDLASVSTKLKGPERAYFALLEEVAGLVLGGVRDGAKSKA